VDAKDKHERLWTCVSQQVISMRLIVYVDENIITKVLKSGNNVRILHLVGDSLIHRCFEASYRPNHENNKETRVSVKLEHKITHQIYSFLKVSFLNLGCIQIEYVFHTHMKYIRLSYMQL